MQTAATPNHHEIRFLRRAADAHPQTIACLVDLRGKVFRAYLGAEDKLEAAAIEDTIVRNYAAFNRHASERLTPQYFEGWKLLNHAIQHMQRQG